MPAIILAIIFGFVFMIVKMGMDHERAKLKLKEGVGENSMTTSELKSLIDEAVQDAIAPLERRIEELASGSRLPSNALPEASRRLNLDEWEEVEEDDAVSQPVKRRTH